MTPELQILLGSIVGGTGALLSYWAGWRARGRAQRAIDTSARVRRADAELYTKFFDPSLGVRWVEGHTQRGNGSGGPTTPKPDIIPKPQPPGGRLIGPNGAPVGYRPKPRFPSPRTIRGNQP